MTPRVWRAWIKLGWVLCVCLLAGCGPVAKQDPTSADTAGLQPGDRAFQVKGVVRDVPIEGGTLVVRHEEIPGYMPKMTMELTVLNTNELVGLKAGDAIEFRLVARAEDHFIDRIRRTGAADASTAAAPPEATPAAEDVDAEDAMLEPGDAVPDLGLRLETGEDMTLSYWRGSAVAMTFFFTRCPLPDFCPRMNKNFEKARSLLMQNGAGPTNWVFLSLSFDSDFDQPKVLQTHAGIYRGTDARGWWFAALSPEGVKVVKPAFDLIVGREGGSFSHNLRTVVVDSSGRVFRQFNGNRWTAEELAEAMMEASRGDRVKAADLPLP